jgi:hypothetical protein
MTDLIEDAMGPPLSQAEISFTFESKSRRKGAGHKQGADRGIEPGNVPRISRLMALAIRFDGLVRCKEVRDYADLARLGYVTRARITQIMNLLNLAPDIQEALLFLPRILKGRDPIHEKDVRSIAAVYHWHRQRKMWAKLIRECQLLE